MPEQALKGLAALEPIDVDPASVAEAVVRIVDARLGTRPFRVHIDPSQDGAEVAERVRIEMYRNIGFQDLLKPSQLS